MLSQKWRVDLKEKKAKMGKKKRKKEKNQRNQEEKSTKKGLTSWSNGFGLSWLVCQG